MREPKEVYGHRPCTRCGDLMQMTVEPDAPGLRWLWKCRSCGHQIDAPTHPGRPRPFPERPENDKQGG